MKYLVMIYSNPASRAVWDGFSDAEKAAGLTVYASLIEDLAGTGELVVTEALADPSHGRRPVPGPASTGDGPYAEAKEHLAGFFLVDCAGMDRALEIAARIPESSYGLVEVRPTMTYDGMDV
ncbi:MAG TPA: YciI family protein [Mycobacteriales bacterium]|nr:YciI family protein [Mycobacteriales bacterium]